MSQQNFKVKICGEDNLELSSKIKDSLAARLGSGNPTEDEIFYVSKLDLSLVKGNLELEEKELEQLRQLCSLWDLRFKPLNISSHRKFIGPLIVAAKKFLYPIVKIFLKDVIEQQRRFNATSVALVAHLLNKKNSTKQ